RRRHGRAPAGQPPGARRHPAAPPAPARRRARRDLPPLVRCGGRRGGAGMTTATATPDATATPMGAVPRPGWRIVARKELADHVSSLRLVVLLALVGLTAAGSVYAAASGIRDAAGEAAEASAIFLRLFTAAPERFPSFFTLIGFLAPLLGIAFGVDAVNGERSQGTLARLLAQPLHRDDVITAKFAAGLRVSALTRVARAASES